jgi:hypothetical protein
MEVITLSLWEESFDWHIIGFKEGNTEDFHEKYIHSRFYDIL